MTKVPCWRYNSKTHNALLKEVRAGTEGKNWAVETVTETWEDSYLQLTNSSFSSMFLAIIRPILPGTIYPEWTGNSDISVSSMNYEITALRCPKNNLREKLPHLVFFFFPGTLGFLWTWQYIFVLNLYSIRTHRKQINEIKLCISLLDTILGIKMWIKIKEQGRLCYSPPPHDILLRNTALNIFVSLISKTSHTCIVFFLS